jgi:hypothetical protein
MNFCKNSKKIKNDSGISKAGTPKSLPSPILKN